MSSASTPPDADEPHIEVASDAAPASSTSVAQPPVPYLFTMIGASSLVLKVQQMMYCTLFSLYMLI
jgi:hypothetical protein